MANVKTESPIVTDPDILGGSYPVFRGTRVPLDTFLSHIKDGGTIDYFLLGFPTVTRTQLEAALEYAMNLSCFVKGREESRD